MTTTSETRKAEAFAKLNQRRKEREPFLRTILEALREAAKACRLVTPDDVRKVRAFTDACGVYADWLQDRGDKEWEGWMILFRDKATWVGLSAISLTTKELGHVSLHRGWHPKTGSRIPFSTWAKGLGRELAKRLAAYRKTDPRRK